MTAAGGTFGRAAGPPRAGSGVPCAPGDGPKRHRPAPSPSTDPEGGSLAQTLGEVDGYLRKASVNPLALRIPDLLLASPPSHNEQCPSYVPPSSRSFSRARLVLGSSRARFTVRDAARRLLTSSPRSRLGRASRASHSRLCPRRAPLHVAASVLRYSVHLILWRWCVAES